MTHLSLTARIVSLTSEKGTDVEQDEVDSIALGLTDDLLGAARYMTNNTSLCPVGFQHCFDSTHESRRYFLDDADACCECWAWYLDGGEA